MQKINKYVSLNSNALKIIAMISMTIDHMGLILFNNLFWMRAIGRIAFPIFAFLVGEGCFYSKNRYKYFKRLFILGCFCQIIAIIFEKIFLLNILITFSLSVLFVILFENFRKNRNSLTFFSFAAVTVLSITISSGIIKVEGEPIINDYGAIGIMLPIFCFYLKNNYTLFPLMLVCLAILTFQTAAIQAYSLFSILVLLLYNGKLGRYNLKKFFYLYYPVHLGAIYLISFFI